MPPKAKNPATSTAVEDQHEVRTAEDQKPERDPLQDVIRRLERLERIVL